MIKQLNLEYRERRSGKTTELINKAITGVKSGGYARVILIGYSMMYLLDLKHRIKYKTGVESLKYIKYGYSVAGVDILLIPPIEYFYMGKSSWWTKKVKWLILIDEPELVVSQNGSNYLPSIYDILDRNKKIEVDIYGLGSIK